jgi:ribose 5-phosphate isomerase A
VQTQNLAACLGIPLTTLEEVQQIDVTIDGADEFDPELRLIKGGGGALLREKVVASATRDEIIITDSSKQVLVLGKFPYR